jgi:hypothetical protein
LVRLLLFLLLIVLVGSTTVGGTFEEWERGKEMGKVSEKFGKNRESRHGREKRRKRKYHYFLEEDEVGE